MGHVDVDAVGADVGATAYNAAGHAAAVLSAVDWTNVWVNADPSPRESDWDWTQYVAVA